jgi:hypothetical protein
LTSLAACLIKAGAPNQSEGLLTRMSHLNSSKHLDAQAASLVYTTARVVPQQAQETTWLDGKEKVYDSIL